jgi:hypothetical protein
MGLTLFQNAVLNDTLLSFSIDLDGLVSGIGLRQFSSNTTQITDLLFLNCMIITLLLGVK